MAIDLVPLWDFARPEVSEQRFQAALESAANVHVRSCAKSSLRLMARVLRFGFVITWSLGGRSLQPLIPRPP